MKKTICLFGWMLLLCGTVFAQKHAKGAHPLQKVYVQEDLSEIRTDGRYNQRTQMPEVLYEPSFTVKSASPEAMGRQYLQRQSKRLGLRNRDLSDIKFIQSRELEVGTVVRFVQTHGAYEIEDSEIVITIDRDNRVIFVANGYKSDIQSILGGFASKSDRDATEIATSYLGVPANNRSVAEGTVWLYNRGEIRLVKKTVVLAGAEWHVYTDATGGNVVQALDKSINCKDESHHLHIRPNIALATQEAIQNPNALLVAGTAKVFNMDPLSSSRGTYGANGITDNADATTTQLDAQRITVNLDVTQVGANYELSNSYAKIYEWEAPAKGLFSQTSSNWNATRTDDSFEATNAFYWVTESMKYINTTLGITLKPRLTTVIQIDPHGENGDDNSHFSESTDELIFGEGGVDDAEDADVVTHELAHGIHSWLTNGNLSNTQGLSEGFADYWAQSHSRSLNHWQTADAGYQWVFNWDGHNEYWDGRITNYATTYNINLGGLHDTGQIFSTCMMKVWDVLGRQKTDKLVLQGLALTNSSAKQQDAALAINNVSRSTLTGAESAIVNNILTGCGYSVPQATLNTTLTTVSTATPGSTITLNVNISNGLGNTLNNVVATSNIPSGTTYVAGSANCSGVQNGANVQFSFATMAAGQSQNCSYQVAVPANFSTGIRFAERSEGTSSQWSMISNPVTPVWVQDATVSANSFGTKSFKSNSQGSVSLQSMESVLTGRVKANDYLVFHHKYDLESDYDGGVVEIQPEGGTWTDLGANWVLNGYNSTIDDAYNSPIAGRLAFSGQSAGYTNGVWVNSIASLSAFDGKKVKIAFRNGSDDSTVETGWWVDDIRVISGVSTQSCVSASTVAQTCSPSSVIIIDNGSYITTDVQQEFPSEINVSSAYPNPFSDSAQIQLRMVQTESVKVTVYDALGRQVARLNDGNLEAGSLHTFTLDGTKLPAGMYIFEVLTPTQKVNRSVMLVQ